MQGEGALMMMLGRFEEDIVLDGRHHEERPS
jgi:hypothetical protein